MRTDAYKVQRMALHRESGAYYCLYGAIIKEQSPNGTVIMSEFIDT